MNGYREAMLSQLGAHIAKVPTGEHIKRQGRVKMTNGDRMPGTIGFKILKGRKHFWSNWYIDQLVLDMPMFKIPDITLTEELLAEIFDNIYSAILLPMPKENWN